MPRGFDMNSVEAQAQVKAAWPGKEPWNDQEPGPKEAQEPTVKLLEPEADMSSSKTPLRSYQTFRNLMC